MGKSQKIYRQIILSVGFIEKMKQDVVFRINP